MSPCVLNGGVSVDVGQETQAEAVRVGGGVSETVHVYAVMPCMKSLPHSVVELVIHDGAPVLRLLVLHWLHVCHTRVTHLVRSVLVSLLLHMIAGG